MVPITAFSEGMARAGFRFTRPKAEGPPVFSLFPDFRSGSPADADTAAPDAGRCACDAPSGDRLDLPSLDVRYTHVQAFLRIEDGAKSGLKDGLYSLDIRQLQFRLKAITAYTDHAAGRDPVEGAKPDGKSGDPDKVQDKNPDGGQGKPDEILQKLLDYFSPEKTSDRIFKFALQGYGQGSFTKPDDSDQRTRFSDFILPYIEKGFKEARDMLGKLPDDVAAKVDKTLSLIHDRFQAFAAGTPPDGKADEA